jgi:hypothetical protein
VGSGGTLILGCSPSFGCANTTSNTIGGDVRAFQPLGLLFHSNTVRGDISVRGGGGGVSCAPQGVFALFGSPVFTTFEDTTLGGDYSVSGYRSCWLGFFRNNVRGDVRITNNTLADPDANEVATNTIRGDLICRGNSPAAQIGDSGGAPNVVKGDAVGECASLVTPRI